MLDNRIFVYKVYGLTVSSEFEMKEVQQCNPESAIDVRVKFANLGRMNPNGVPLNPALPPDFSFSERKQVMILPAVGAFILVGLDTVLVERADGVSNELLAVAFLGPVIAILLHLRGKFVLHGSAIVYDNKAYGFVGDKGAGKSTLAAMLLKNPNVDFLTDDLLVMTDELEALSGYQQMKLSDEALEHSNLQLGHVRSPPHKQFPKNQFLLNHYKANRSVPVGGIYELRRDTEARTEHLELQDAMRVLLRFSYIARFVDREMSRTEKQEFLNVTSRLAFAGCVKRLYVPNQISDLDQVIESLRVK